MKTFALITLTIILLAGCATGMDTIRGIADDPTAYKIEADNIQKEISETMPAIPYAASVAIGYGLAFLRRWYKEIKKEQAGKTTRP
jgi:hypothetical protein